MSRKLAGKSYLAVERVLKGLTLSKKYAKDVE
jgi:hypothetical protein